MRYRAVLFDLDGVLCSTDQYHYQAWKQIADSVNTEFTKTDNNRLRGVSRMESLDILLEKCPKKLDQEQKERLAAEKNRIYRKLLEKMTAQDAAEGTEDLLRTLKEMGISTAVASSSKNVEFILSGIGLAEAFDTVVGGTMITKSKPDPEVFLKASEILELSPGECLVIEDARAGVDAARAGGFTCAAIGDAAAYEKADYSIEKLMDIIRIIKGGEV